MLGWAALRVCVYDATLTNALFSGFLFFSQHAGWIYKRYTPTYRGFDTCLVSSGNLDGYWGSQSGGHCTKDATGDIVRFDGFDEERAEKQRQLADGSDDDSAPVAGMATDLLRGVGETLTPARGGSFGNGTVYDARMYTAEAKELIAAHDTAQSFYLYMAFHNVHVPIEFPRATAERYPFVASDARKGTDAQLTELDWTVGNISQALEARNMLDDTLFIFHSEYVAQPRCPVRAARIVTPVFLLTHPSSYCTLQQRRPRFARSQLPPPWR